MPLRLPKLDKTMPIVGFRLRDAKGRLVEHEAIATPQMQRFWQSAVIKSDTGSDDAATKVSQVNTTLYVTPTISDPPTRAEVQAIANAVGLIADALTK